MPPAGPFEISPNEWRAFPSRRHTLHAASASMAVQLSLLLHELPVIHPQGAAQPTFY